MRARLRPVIVLAFVTGLAVPVGLLAQEHPSEHPKPAEHPKGHAMGVTMEQLGTAIETHIKGEMAKGGGVWKLEDPE